MADTQDLPKAVIKGARRASFARALHVPAIGRRKQAHLVDNIHRTSSPSQEIAGRTPLRHLSPQPATISINARRVSDDDEGAEIPDIPLRRSANTRETSVDHGGPQLATLERMLTEDDPHEPPDGHHFGPTSPSFAVSRGNKRYSAQLTAFWEPHVRPHSKDSRERSLSDVLEASPAPSITNGIEPASEPQQGPSLPRESHSAPESVAASVVSTQGARSPSTYPRSSRDRAADGLSIFSTSLQAGLELPLPGLQTKGADEACDALEPVAEKDVQPGSFDLIVPATSLGVYHLERRSELLFSVAHLRVIFEDPIFLHRFTTFVSIYRPQSVPLLRYYLDALKAIRAMEWVNNIILESLRLDGYDFAANGPPQLTENESLRQMSEAAFEVLARDQLPAYITHVWTEIVEMSMKRRITGTLPAHLQNMSDGLAEVFCITDPSRTDNPIVFTSEEFHRTTQYGLDYVIGRNCRFLQGPKTNPFAVKRIRESLEQGKVHYETFLNYRRDGSPFMNLLMCAPLMDSTGSVRYFLGAQIDVSGLAKGCSGLESLRRLVDQDDEDQRLLLSQSAQGTYGDGHPIFINGTDGFGMGESSTTSTSKDPRLGENKEDEFRLLCELFNRQELETARRFGGRMHRSQQEQVQHLESISNWHKRRVVIQDNENSPPATPGQPVLMEPHDLAGNYVASPRSPTPGPAHTAAATAAPTPVRSPRVPTIYENYLVVRPHPSLRILFASPSLRVPGILQSHLMSRVGGSRRIHEELEQAFAMGQGVTAKVKWIPGGARGDVSSNGNVGGLGLAGKEGRTRWIHCTPLIGSNGNVGVWVVVIVDDEDTSTGGGGPDGRRQRGQGDMVSSPTTAAARAAGLHRHGDSRRRDRDSSTWDSMSLNDFAAMNSLPDDEDLRQHVKEMYGAVRRRERAARGERGLGKGRLDPNHYQHLASGGQERQHVPKTRVLDGSDLSSGGYRDAGGRLAELRRGDGTDSRGGSRPGSPFTLKVGELP